MQTPILTQADHQRDSGQRLRAVIRMLGMRQTEAAELMGISKHVLRNWLVGDNPIQPYGLYRLCRAKGVDYNFIHLGDWSRLPYELAAVLEKELTASLAGEAAPVAEEAEAERLRQPS